MPNKNLSLALNLAAVAAGMLLMAYASVPLYRIFCQVTGYGGTPKQATTASSRMLDREITVAFNADMAPGLPWEFRPDQKSLTVRVGQSSLAHYTARNLTQNLVAGRATYNVLPIKAGAYFAKIDCFCFEEQTLAPEETVHMPVLFYIDPAIADDPNMKDVKTITLSYTFFAVKQKN